jgi:hypothetical protein
MATVGEYLPSAPSLPALELLIRTWEEIGERAASRPAKLVVITTEEEKCARKAALISTWHTDDTLPCAANLPTKPSVISQTIETGLPESEVVVVPLRAAELNG